MGGLENNTKSLDKINFIDNGLNLLFPRYYYKQNTVNNFVYLLMTIISNTIIK